MISRFHPLRQMSSASYIIIGIDGDSTMSGHSKWHSIRHKKAIVDAKRGAKFTKLIKELVVAARMGGSDADANPRLRLAIQNARDMNMPKDNIERAVKKGAGELEGVSYEDFQFEGYGQGGVAILVEGTTDNMNRTAPEMRHLFSKHGGKFGEQGSVNWMFKKKGVIMVPAEGLEEDQVMEVSIDAGAEDLEDIEGYFRILTEPGTQGKVRQAIETSGIKVESSTMENIPDNTVAVDADEARKLMTLLESLEEHDDVSSVSANYEMDDALIEELSGA
jgi:YebC/PmpR family DNA-binding regulatory protein